MMYWSDWGNAARIEKASMDGANRTVLHDTYLKWPNAITLDIPTQTLFWADARLDKVESSNVDGSNRQLILRAKGMHPFGITMAENELYFSDWGKSAIFHVNVTEEAAVPLRRVGHVDFCKQLPSGIKFLAQSKQLSSKLIGAILL